jgi:cell pole-organizing protein PopZ
MRRRLRDARLESTEMSDFNDISNSSGPGSSAEPSMEEILASIRRILKEDTGNLPAKVDIDDDVLLLDDTMLAKPVDFSSGTELPPESALISPHPDAAGATFQQAGHFSSEPTFSVDDYANTEEPAAPEPATPLAETHHQADYAHEELQGQEQPEPLAPALSETEFYQPAPYQPEPYAPEPYAQPYATPHTPEPRIFHDTEQEPIYRQQYEEPMSENVEPPHGLLSEEASNAAANSIGSLVRSISADRAVAVSRGGVTIEDIVREEIRPVLKAWMDTHLPSLVERLVRQEIERVVERGAG